MRNDLAERIINDNGGIVRTAVLNDFGMENYELSRLCSAGYIRRIRHGFYGLSDVPEDRILSAVFPEGIVCLESALFHYGYGDRPPSWDIALPRNISRSRLSMNCLNFRPFLVRDEWIMMGRTLDTFDSTVLYIYDRERTICDIFRYRKKLGEKVFVRAVNTYSDDPEKDQGKLMEYAEKMHIADRVSAVMNVVLNRT